jgi:hypothetical protein
MIASSPVPSAVIPASINEAASERLDLTLFPTSLPSSSLATFSVRYPSALVRDS